MPLNSFQGADFIWTISVPCPILFNMNASVCLLPYSSSQIIEKSCCPHLVLVQLECNCTCAYFLLCAIIDIQHLHWCLDWIKYYKIKIKKFPPCAPPSHPSRPPPSQWQPLPPNVPTTYIVANMITAHQHTSSNIPCSSCTTLPTPLVISKPTLGSTTI